MRRFRVGWRDARGETGCVAGTETETNDVSELWCRGIESPDKAPTPHPTQSCRKTTTHHYHHHYPHSRSRTNLLLQLLGLSIFDRCHPPLPQLLPRLFVPTQVELCPDEDDGDIGGVVLYLWVPLWEKRGGKERKETPRGEWTLSTRGCSGGRAHLRDRETDARVRGMRGQ